MEVKGIERVRERRMRRSEGALEADKRLMQHPAITSQTPEGEAEGRNNFMEVMTMEIVERVEMTCIA